MSGRVPQGDLSYEWHPSFLEVLVARGNRYLFGNPGSTELPLSDALAIDRASNTF